MAYASANRRTVNLGGGLKLSVGTWSCLEGDADGTENLPGAQVFFAFWFRGTSTEYGDFVPVSYAAGAVSGTTTVTIPCNTVCAAGRYVTLTA